LTENTKELFSNAIKSVEQQKVMPEELVIVTPKGSETAKYLKSYDYGKIKTIVSIVENEGETDFASQVNLGVSKAKYNWVSFLELDDEYANIWFNNVLKYSEFYPDVDAFLPIVVDVDNKDTFAGFTNEATFAANFTQEMGYLNNETLLDYQNFQTAGMVIKKSKLEDFGSFKSSVKLTFVYEFLLRMTYNSLRIMTIPKLGYKHTSMREGSIFWNYKNGDDVMTENEVKFWISTAKKEYFFKDDRNIKYEVQNA
jgi:GT2 family glycosyltransferase